MTEWLKHGGGIALPEGIEKDTPIEVETWVATGNTFALARELNWAAVKFYRIATDSVGRARANLQAELEAPRKDFSVFSEKGAESVNGYQAACQRATDLFKEGQEPVVVIRYSKQLSGTTISSDLSTSGA